MMQLRLQRLLRFVANTRNGSQQIIGCQMMFRRRTAHEQHFDGIYFGFDDRNIDCRRLVVDFGFASSSGALSRPREHSCWCSLSVETFSAPHMQLCGSDCRVLSFTFSIGKSQQVFQIESNLNPSRFCYQSVSWLVELLTAAEVICCRSKTRNCLHHQQE